MALDIHIKETNEWLFGIEDPLFDELQETFEEFYQKLGLRIDLYMDLHISVEHQIILLDLLEKTPNKSKELIKLIEVILHTIRNKQIIFLFCD